MTDDTPQPHPVPAAEAKDFWAVMKEQGYTFFAGVPCSILTEILVAGLEDPDIDYVPAVRENVALGMASGAWLSGRKSGILIQNSGLGNIMNALTSFNLIYRIPALLCMTWRGFQGKDAPEHIIMGDKMLELLALMDIPAIVLDQAWQEQLREAMAILEERQAPVAVIIKKGAFR